MHRVKCWIIMGLAASLAAAVCGCDAYFPLQGRVYALPAASSVAKSEVLTTEPPSILKLTPLAGAGVSLLPCPTAERARWHGGRDELTLSDGFFRTDTLFGFGHADRFSVRISKTGYQPVEYELPWDTKQAVLYVILAPEPTARR